MYICTNQVYISRKISFNSETSAIYILRPSSHVDLEEIGSAVYPLIASGSFQARFVGSKSFYLTYFLTKIVTRFKYHNDNPRTWWIKVKLHFQKLISIFISIVLTKKYNITEESFVQCATIHATLQQSG